MRYFWNILKEHISLSNIVIVLIAIMTIVVVRDRIKFHNHVYKNAKSCIDLIKEKQNQQGYQKNWKKHVINIDSLSCILPENEQTTKYEVYVSYNSPNYNDKTYIENSKLDALEKSDGLLDANSLTYLITLIVVLLVTLVINSTEKFEEKAKDHEEKAKALEERAQPFEEKAKALEEKAKALEEKAKALEEKAKALEEKANSHRQHTTKYDSVLTRIESLYNLSIIMGNVILSLPSAGKNKIQETFLQQIGMFLYRMSKMCKQIEAHFNNQITIDYMTPEEKNIINTFIEDALNELDRNKNYAEKDLQIPKLSVMIENVMDSINEISEKLNEIEIRKES